MGEYADMLIDEIYDSYHDYECDYECDDYPPSLVRKTKKFPTCKYCLKPNLIWKQVDKKWFLYETNEKIHDCPRNPLSTNILEKLLSSKVKEKGNLMQPEFAKKWNDVMDCEFPYYDVNRLTKDEYGCLIAKAVSGRSEDPHSKVGCCVVNKSGRILSTGYNGLLPGESVPSILKEEEYRDIKRILFIHAETNALSLINEGDGDTIYLTMNPCSACASNISRHMIKNVVFINDYPMSDEYKYIFKFYGVNFRKISEEEVNNINNFINNMKI